uniref:Transposable element Tcb1 transposase n=1 Tax=Salmo salar TaxID=8030 RepID=B9EMB3_SALSA|nr:Transposable element Tcb1 transposase [Salmo salar]
MTARAQRRMLNEVKQNPRVSAEDLKISLEHANISVDKSTTRKTLNKNGVHGRTPRKKPLLSKKNIAERLKFAKEHLDVPPRYWQNILWTDNYS